MTSERDMAEELYGEANTYQPTPDYLGEEYYAMEREAFAAHVAQYKTCANCRNSVLVCNTSELAGQTFCLACLERAAGRIGRQEWNAFAAALAARGNGCQTMASGK